MTKTFAAHLIDARNAVTAAETFSVVKVMGEKLTRNRDKVNWLHCCHGRAADAMHYSEKLVGWNRLYNEAVAIWRERSARLSTEEATAIVMNAYGITSLVTEPAA